MAAPLLRITLGVDLADQMGMTAFAINSARHDLLDHMRKNRDHGCWCHGCCSCLNGDGIIAGHASSARLRNEELPRDVWD